MTMQSTTAAGSLFALLLSCYSTALWGQNPPDAQLWLTTVDRQALFALQRPVLHFAGPRDALQTISVNDMQQYQPIEGFG